MCVPVDKVWDHLSVRTCGHCLRSCECLYVWTQFFLIYVRLCTCGQRFELSKRVNV